MSGFPRGLPRFLDVDNVLEIHAQTLELEGGLAGVRDFGTLESAVRTPQQVFGGAFLHPDLASMAAAYLYHLAMNHPFLDGNKRAAAMSSLAFLRWNSVRLVPGHLPMTNVTLAVASGESDKQRLTVWFREHLRGADDAS